MFHLQKLTIVAMLATAAAGVARAQVSLSVDRLDGGDPGAPAPAGLVVVDVFANVATTDTWTAAGMPATVASGAMLVYGADVNELLVNPSRVDEVGVDPSRNDPFVTCVSKPLARASSNRFFNAGAAVAGRFNPTGPTATATASEVNVAWFASPPATSNSPSVDGYIARLAIDISGAVGIDPETITVSTDLPPSGTVVLLVSQPCSGFGCSSAPAGTVAATFDVPQISGINWSVYAFPAGGDPTVFRYSFTDKNPLPAIPDQGPAGNDAFAFPDAELSADTPPNGPASGGNRSLDCRFNGATTVNTLLLPNIAIAARRGFTMEAWFRWNGGGSVNAIIDSSGSEKLVIDLNSGGPPTVTMRFNDDTDYPIGPANPGNWQYVAVVFQASPLNPDGTVTGTLTAYLDSLSAPSVASNVIKSNFGDSLGSGIGIGQHPIGFRHPLEFFDGLIHSPRVSLRALNPNQLLLGGAGFRRGDPNSDGTTDLSDGIAVFNFLFLGGKDPACMESADSNSDGMIDLSDGVFLLNFLYVGGPAPADPGPPPGPCGLSPPGLPGDLGCESYPCE